MTPTYPNQYILLMGAPGSRKSTAIKYGKRLLKKAGYKRMAPDRMSRQAFINEMHAINQPENLGLSLEDILDMEVDYPYEMGINAVEFLDFIGQHDKDYLMLLTTLWDNEDHYENPKVSKTSIRVMYPTVNMISAATAENLQLAFPAGSMDTGTLSRFLFVHGACSGRKILFPPVPNAEKEEWLVKRLAAISKLRGQVTFTQEAIDVLSWIYEKAKPLDDPRFVYYHGRRLTHLYKLILVIVAANLRMEVTEHDVLEANTILGLTEYHMPEAMGHFGRSRQSATVHNVLEWLKEQHKPTKISEIFQNFASDFNSEKEFQAAMMDLQNTGKIVAINEDKKFIGVIVRDNNFPAWLKDIMMLEALTPQERASIGMELPT